MTTSIDANNLKDGTRLEADLCIIGAGAAGITIAKELRNSDINILLLESGGFSYDQETQSLYEGSSSGIPYFPLMASRLRYFGGTTGHWGGWCAPFDEIDFEKRDWVPHSGWPISYQDLHPCYLRAQKVCQLGPYEYHADYWEKEHTTFKRMPLDPKNVSTKIIQFSPPVRFGRDYRESITTSSNVTLCFNANVTTIKTTESASHVTTLEVKTLGGKTFVAKAKKYILACGGIENARILLQSTTNSRHGLGNKEGLVGRFFMEHPHIVSSFMIHREDVNMGFYEPYKYDKKFLPLLGISPKLQKKHRIGNYSCVLQPRAIDNPYQHKYGFTTKVNDIVRMMNEPEGDEDNVKKAPTLTWGLNSRIEQIPNPNSRVTLSNEFDRLGQAKSNLHWQLSTFDKKTIREAQHIIATELGKKQYGRLQIPDWTLQEDNTWPDFLVGGWHHMGTTRMANNAKEGVVNADCKIHEVDNMYIAGSSVFTTSGTANPTLTIVALAIRLADHMRVLFDKNK